MKNALSGSKIDIVVGPAPAPAAKNPDPAPRPPPPKPKETAPAAESPKKPDPTPAPTPAPAARTVPLWMIHKAWKASHGDLVEAYSKNPKGDCAAAYAHVQEALAEMKGRLDADGRNKLQVYLDFYSKIAEDTRTFTELPAGTREEYILKDLSVVANLIDAAFDPARIKK